MKLPFICALAVLLLTEVARGWGWITASRHPSLTSLRMVNVDSLQQQMQEGGTKVLNEGGQAVKGVYSVMKEVGGLPATPESVGSLCDRIDSERDQFKLSTLKAKRYLVLSKILTNDRDLYKQTVLLFSSQIPRSELPNLQDIPYYNTTYVTPTTSQLSVGDLAYQKSLMEAELVESSSVANLTFTNSSTPFCWPSSVWCRRR